MPQVQPAAGARSSRTESGGGEPEEEADGQNGGDQPEHGIAILIVHAERLEHAPCTMVDMETDEHHHKDVNAGDPPDLEGLIEVDVDDAEAV